MNSAPKASTTPSTATGAISALALARADTSGRAKGLARINNAVVEFVHGIPAEAATVPAPRPTVV